MAALVFQHRQIDEYGRFDAGIALNRFPQLRFRCGEVAEGQVSPPKKLARLASAGSDDLEILELLDGVGPASEPKQRPAGLEGQPDAAIPHARGLLELFVGRFGLSQPI